MNKKVFMLGCGSVGMATLPLLTQLIDPRKIIVMDMHDISRKIAFFINKGVTFIKNRLTRANYEDILDRIKPDIFLDCAWNVDTIDMIIACDSRKILFLNTSFEQWNPFDRRSHHTQSDLTLYARHAKLEAIKPQLRNHTTIIIDHGANPGLVSHFVKMAITRIYKKCRLQQPILVSHGYPDLVCARAARTNHAFAIAAYRIGLRVIHISERDTQISRIPRKPGEFVNTWSIEGFMEEGLSPAELGLGSHEDSRALHPIAISTFGLPNQAYLDKNGINTSVTSWVYSGRITGMVIRHGEAFSLSRRLSLFDRDGQLIYRPTVHYVYQPCEAAQESLAEVRKLHLEKHDRLPRERIMYSDIISGRDELGCTLFCNSGVYWIGSLLDINEARRLFPDLPPDYCINATSLQVACSLVSALRWAIAHPTEGVCLPDDLPHKDVMKYALPYLGPFKFAQLRKRVRNFKFGHAE